MKKILPIVVLIIILLLVILLLGLPYLVGRQVEKHVDSRIAYINAQRQDMSLEKVSFDRHWFSSDVVIKVQVNEELATQAHTAIPLTGLNTVTSGKTVDITLHSVISHGPLMLGKNVDGTKRLKVGLGYVHFPVYPKDIENINESLDLTRLATLVKDQPLFTITDLISVFGNDNIHFKTASVHHQEATGKIDWDGVWGNVFINARGNKIDMKTDISPIQFEGNQGQKFLSKEITMSLSQHKDLNGLWTGQSEIKIPELIISNKEGEKMAVTGGGLSFNTRSQKDLFEGDIEAHFDTFTHNAKQFGPMTLKTSLDHLDAKALAVIAQYQVSADQHYNAIANLVRQNQLITAITQVLSNKPKLSVDEFNLKTPEGAISLKGVFALEEQIKQSNGFLQLDPFIKSILLSLDLTLPSPLAEKLTIALAGFYPALLLSPEELNNATLVFSQEQLDQRARDRLQNWADAKLVTKNGNEYTISFKLASGEIKLNDVPVALNQPPLIQATVIQVTPPVVAPAEPVLQTQPAEPLAPQVLPAPAASDVPAVHPVVPVPGQPLPAPAQ